MINEVINLLTEFYEPNKKTRYVELHNRVFPLEKLDENCKFCGSKAFYKLTDFLKTNNMAKTETNETVSEVKYELVLPGMIATVKLFDRRISLDATTPQEVLKAAFNAGHTNYVKVV